VRLDDPKVSPTSQLKVEQQPCYCTKGPHPTCVQNNPLYPLMMAPTSSPDTGKGLVRDVGNNSPSKALCLECEDIFSRWYDRDIDVPKVHRYWHQRDRYIPKAKRPMYHSLRSLQNSARDGCPICAIFLGSFGAGKIQALSENDPHSARRWSIITIQYR
jgi:hypothetical protein